MRVGINGMGRIGRLALRAAFGAADVLAALHMAWFKVQRPGLAVAQQVAMCCCWSQQFDGDVVPVYRTSGDRALAVLSLVHSAAPSLR
jgi:hypothetical protein